MRPERTTKRLPADRTVGMPKGGGCFRQGNCPPKTLLFGALLLAIAFNTSFAAEPINCGEAPAASITQLPSVAADLALVFCSPSGHVLVATDGFVWLAQDGRPHYLHAASPQGPIAGQSQHSVYFTNAAARVLQDEPLEKAKAMFKVEYGFSPADDLSVTQLDLLSNKGFRYNVFFYVMFGRLDRVIGCVDECNKSVGMKQVLLRSLR
jgi:hypothetical protein